MGCAGNEGIGYRAVNQVIIKTDSDPFFMHRSIAVIKCSLYEEDPKSKSGVKRWHGRPLSLLPIP